MASSNPVLQNNKAVSLIIQEAAFSHENPGSESVFMGQSEQWHLHVRTRIAEDAKYLRLDRYHSFPHHHNVRGDRFLGPRF